MKYPKKLAQRADTILAERRRIAEGNHLRTLARLQEKYPEIPETRKKLNGLYGKRSLVSFLGEANMEDIDTQIQKAQEQLDGLMAAAGINEADLQPPYTCPV